jgi:hypothetical protein
MDSKLTAPQLISTPPRLPKGTATARTGNARDIAMEEWAVRDHPHALYLKAYDDGSVRMARGRVVDPSTSMHAGGTVVKGRSKKGKFLRKHFVATNAKSDARLGPPPMRFAQPDPIQYALRHEGTPVKTAKYLPLRSR